MAMIFTSTVRNDNLFPSNFPHSVVKSHKFPVHVNEILRGGGNPADAHFL